MFVQHLSVVVVMVMVMVLVVMFQSSSFNTDQW